MSDNLNASKAMRFIKNKNTVTAICAIAIVIVLIVGYNIRIKSATTPVSVPVARVTIQPKTEITADMIEYIDIPSKALVGNYILNVEAIRGRYSNVNTIIPKGSVFYSEAVIDKQDLPDSSLYDVPEGETLYYLTVNMLSSYSNSILPGNYLDIYLSTATGSKALVGKLLKDVKVLAVKTSDGKNVFENSDESRVPYVVIFSLPEDQHLLLRKVTAINRYLATSQIEIIPVPTTAAFDNSNEQITSNVSSDFLKEYVLDMAARIPDDATDTGNTNTNTETNTEDNAESNITE